MVALTKRLNLIITLKRGDALAAQVHVLPLSRAVFDLNYLLLARAFTAMVTEGILPVAGARVAMQVLRSVDRSPDQAASTALLAEFRRLSTVFVADDKGYTTLPYETARVRGLLDEDEQAEAEGFIAFFILISAVATKDEAETMIQGMCGLWGTSATRLSATDYAASLTKSTAPLNTMTIPQ